MTPLSLAQINAAIISQIEINIAQTAPLLPMAFIRVLAKAIAGTQVLLYKYTGFIFLQLFVASASSRPTTVAGVSLTPLIEWGNLVGAGDPIPATAAELTIDITVINQTGDPIPAGTSLVYEPTGVIYLTAVDILRDAAVKSVDIVASSDQTDGGGLGAVGNLQISALVSFTQPLADVEREPVVSAVVVTGADGEDLDVVYRQRVIDRFQKRPQGGALSDLELWAEETLGIIASYPYTGDQPGTVEVYVEADTVSSGSPDGFPTQAQLDATLVSLKLDENGRATRLPANMFAFVRSITRRAFTIQVVALSAPDLVAAKAAIEAGLVTLFKSFEPFIGGLTVTPRDRITQSEVAGVVDDIAKANNATFSSVIMSSANIAPATASALVTSSANDASQTGTVVTLTGTTLAIIPANTIGIRWVSINVPLGSIVSSATLTMTGKSTKAAYSVITIRGEADSNPVAYAVTANNITSRVGTLNSVEWIPDAWALDVEKTIDITAIISEIIAIAGWTALNSMAITLTSITGSDREAYSFDDTPSKAPKITINFTDPAGPQVSQQVVALAKGEKATLVTPVTF